MDGKTLKNELLNRGISAKSIAQKIGISQQNFSAALQGDDIRTGLLEKVAEAIGVSPAYFYTGEDSGTALVGTATQSTVIGKQETGTAALEKQLSVKDQQIALKDQQIDRLLALLERWK